MNVDKLINVFQHTDNVNVKTVVKRKLENLTNKDVDKKKFIEISEIIKGEPAAHGYGKHKELIAVKTKSGRTIQQLRTVGQKQEESTIKKPKTIEWWDGFKKYDLSVYPIGIPKEDVKVDESGDVHSHAILTWKTVSKNGIKSQKRAYSKEFMQRNAQEKWNRVKNVTSATVGLLKKQSEKFIGGEDDKKSQAASIINIIANTGLRRGDPKLFALSGNRGVTTLSKENVEVSGDTVKFNFIGKSYKQNKATIKNKKLAEFMSKRIKESKGKFIFDISKQYLDNFFKGDMKMKGLKIKDLRTYVATDMGRELLFGQLPDVKTKIEGLDGKKTKKVLQDTLNQVFETVSIKLNNTPAMVKTSYLHPVVIDSWLMELGVDKELLKGQKTLDDIISEFKDMYKTTGKPIVEDEIGDDLYPLPSWWDETI
jgi:DNA topoisomerase IB